MNEFIFLDAAGLWERNGFQKQFQTFFGNDWILLFSWLKIFSPTSHTFFNILATFGHLKKKIIICYSMYADREGIELFASFCSMWIGLGIIEISDINKDNVNTTQREQLDLVFVNASAKKLRFLIILKSRTNLYLFLDYFL